MTAESVARERFLEEYRHIRHAEGRGSDDSEYYRALPRCDPNDRNAAMWQMRSSTYRYFEKHILAPMEVQERRALDILDLGAGNCWLSNRLSLRNHRPVALDIFSDERDGLRAARHYKKRISIVESDFDQLPLPSAHFDLAIFNASLHYSTDYIQTLSEVRRCLRPCGAVVILDSPIYRLKEYGMRMIAEKQAHFTKQYGFPSDALHSIDFLDIPTLQGIQQSLDMEWEIFKPWYGWRWHLRPLHALLQRRRPPSRFWILVGRFLAR